MKRVDGESPLALLRRQRSHMLLVLSQPKPGREADFLRWYQDSYRRTVADTPGVLSLRHYAQHEVDVTRGRHPRLPFRYLGLCELSLDGAQEAQRAIEGITRLHREYDGALAPATWLYYPLSEKVGRAAAAAHSMLTLAFANPMSGQEAAFREWYATRHIRHALNIPALVSGQCFLRTQFQQPGIAEAGFDMIAIYEQEDTPEAIIASITSLPKELFHFPTLDGTRFAEATYRLCE